MNEKIDAETKRCLLCVHIPFEFLISTVEELIDDKTKAYEIAEKAAKLIKETYIAKPYILCGRRYSIVAGAAIWIVSQGILTQGEIAKKLNTMEDSIRACSKLFIGTPKNELIRICKICGKTYQHKAIHAERKYQLIRDGEYFSYGAKYNDKKPDSKHYINSQYRMVCSEECATEWKNFKTGYEDIVKSHKNYNTIHVIPIVNGIPVEAFSEEVVKSQG